MYYRKVSCATFPSCPHTVQEGQDEEDGDHFSMMFSVFAVETESFEYLSYSRNRNKYA